ncbi:SixA phosphatase family protein [Pacificoceanicola onchidii]|uniref:SixA phosphatase family protein n=1 Tax=Pacificoceanicola onchidii TaxID=2562685 RepID=UPI0010A3EF87|nr:histidine phosphatase family protein [Pacificoceanicola onchidii]
MKRLILMRHAKSDWSFDLEDHARPLNARGQRSAKALGDWLHEKGYAPDRVLCSDAARTKETLKRSALDAPVNYLSALYNAAPATILDLLFDTTKGDTVLVLAHNPGIGILMSSIVKSPPNHPKFDFCPTGATLVVDFDIDHWTELQLGSGKVADYIVPRDLVE